MVSRRCVLEYGCTLEWMEQDPCSACVLECGATLDETEQRRVRDTKILMILECSGTLECSESLILCGGLKKKIREDPGPGRTQEKIVDLVARRRWSWTWSHAGGLCDAQLGSNTPTARGVGGFRSLH